jgi:hypothetical protein
MEEAFHTALTFLAIIGKRFGDAGLSDLLIESKVVASGSVPAVLEGRQYNRAMRAHKIVMEAFQRLQLTVFKEWMSENRQSDYQASTQVLDKVCITQTAEMFDRV